MKTALLIAGAAVAGMVAGGAAATTHKSHRSHTMSSDGGAYAAPAQPIPYVQLDSYIHASPSQRASMGGSSPGMSPTDNAQGGMSQGGMSQGSGGDMSSSAAPNPGAGDQMSGGAAAGSSMSPSTEDSGKMGQSQPGNPSPPTDATGTPPK
jgi:hypothetical protein